MPHQCTNCGRTFDDGSKEMLSGCPDCGGNKFQFRPAGADLDGPSDDPDPPDAEPPDPAGGVAGTVGRTAATVRDLVGGSPDEPPDGSSAPDRSSATERSAGTDTASGDGTATDTERTDAHPDEGPDAPEDAAQASARGDVVADDELPEAADGTEDGSASADRADASGRGSGGNADATMPAGPTADADGGPDLEQLRKELNDQFESIRVLQPGRYELNLMELYDREEYIIALQEDGRYSIQVPETVRG